MLSIKWLDSAKIVRRTWPEFKERGYGLGNICNRLNICFKHHNALEDAIAAGKVVCSAINESGYDINSWLLKATTSINSKYCDKNNIKHDGNPDGILYGETIVFTGTLSITRKEAALIAANAGCNVIDSVNKDCTILVLGQQDIDKLAGKSKSAKQIKAEKLISEGNQLSIISEDDFRNICNIEY